eukprot:1159524-Pelagomonas_calceolata.AAC.5
MKLCSQDSTLPSKRALAVTMLNPCLGLWLALAVACLELWLWRCPCMTICAADAVRELSCCINCMLPWLVLAGVSWRWRKGCRAGSLKAGFAIFAFFVACAKQCRRGGCPQAVFATFVACVIAEAVMLAANKQALQYLPTVIAYAVMLAAKGSSCSVCWLWHLTL